MIAIASETTEVLRELELSAKLSSVGCTPEEWAELDALMKKSAARQIAADKAAEQRSEARTCRPFRTNIHGE